MKVRSIGYVGPPSGAYFWAIIELVRDVPGGFDLILDGDADEERCWGSE